MLFLQIYVFCGAVVAVSQLPNVFQALGEMAEAAKKENYSSIKIFISAIVTCVLIVLLIALTWPIIALKGLNR